MEHLGGIHYKNDFQHSIFMMRERVYIGRFPTKRPLINNYIYSILNSHFLNLAQLRLSEFSPYCYIR